MANLISKTIIFVLYCIVILTGTDVLIFYLQDSNQEISLHSYHPNPTNNHSRYIKSFKYGCNNYKVVPIWECKIALVGGEVNNKSTSKCNETGIIDMSTLEFKVYPFSFIHQRNGFATELVNGSRLYVCGGRQNNACEFWEKGEMMFQDSGDPWQPEKMQKNTIENATGIRFNLTLHQIGNELCMFGGFIDVTTTKRTKITRCISLSNSTEIRDISSDKDESFRGGHTSAIYKAQGNIIVIKCLGRRSNNIADCDVLKISGNSKVKLEIWKLHKRTSEHAKLIKWRDELLLFGARFHSDEPRLHVLTELTEPCNNERSVINLLGQMSWTVESPIRNCLSANVGEINLFTVKNHCYPGPDRSTTITSKGEKETCQDVQQYQIPLGIFVGISGILIVVIVIGCHASCEDNSSPIVQGETDSNIVETSTQVNTYNQSHRSIKPEDIVSCSMSTSSKSKDENENIIH